MHDTSNALTTQTPAPSPAPTEPSDVQQNLTPCDIWKTSIPGLQPELLVHKSLSPKQMAALYMLLRGQSDQEVAKQLDVTRQTIFRWRKKDEVFRAELARQREAQFQRSEDRLQAMLEPAMSVLERQIQNVELMERRPELAVRVASTIAKLALARPPESAQAVATRSARAQDRMEEARLRAYINAPMPDGSNGPPYV